MKTLMAFLSGLTLSSSICLAQQGGGQEILDRAIIRAGGRQALEASPILEWRATATIHIPNRTIEIAGEWEVQPDSAVVATWPVGQPGAPRRMILSRSGGWTQRGTGAPTVMPQELLIEERHQFYLYSLLRLVPLRDPSYHLAPAPADGLGRLGLRVVHPDHPEVTLYFDPSYRVAGLRTIFAAADTSARESQEIDFSGTVESGGVQWFQEMRIRRGGQPYFDLRISDFRASPGG